MNENENKIIHEQETEEQEIKEHPFVKTLSDNKQFKCIYLILFGMLLCFQHLLHLDYYDFEWWTSTLCGVLGLAIAFSSEIRRLWDIFKRLIS